MEYLEVYVPEEQELMLEESKDLHDGCLKSESSTSDSDSGRGSCDSHTLLMDKCGDSKEEEKQTDQESGRTGTEAQRHQKGWEEKALTYGHENMVSPDMSSGRVKTWPSVFSPLPQYTSSPLDQQSSLEMAKQHYLSDSLFPPGSMSSYLTPPGHSTKEALGPNYWEFSLSNKQPHLLHSQAQTRRQLQAYSDVDISSIGHKQAPAGLQSPVPRPTEYVEVQRVNEEDMVLLQPVVVSGRGRIEGCPQMPHGEEYSRVKGVDSDNMLLLQREVMEEDRCTCEDLETNGVTENCYTSSTTTQKPTACIHTAMPAQDEKALAVNGYVDTATMFTLPIH